MINGDRDLNAPKVHPATRLASEITREICADHDPSDERRTPKSRTVVEGSMVLPSERWYR